MIRLLLVICIGVITATSSSMAGNGYYYAVDDSISVNISDDFMAVQLDSLQIGVDIGMIVTGKPCLSSEPEPEHLGRGFYIVALAPECSYDLAAGNLMTDPEVTRIAPVYVTPDGGLLNITDLVSVQFEPQLNWASVVPLLTDVNLEVVDTSDFTPNLVVASVIDTISGGPLEIGNTLHRLPETIYACATFYASIAVEYVPDDPYFQYQYYFNNPGGMGSVEDADIDADSAWLITLGDPELEIAVLDMGITAHEDLPASRITMGYDAIGPFGWNAVGDWDPSPGMDKNHGMACAGILAASHNGIGVTGLVPNCMIRPVKIFGDDGISTDETYKIAEAIDYAAQHGPVVLSNSWGFRNQRYPLPDIQQAIIRATSVQVNRDYSTVVVFSAGNVGEYINYIPFPKWMDEVICVGATDREDDRWFYSCYGPELDVVAPSGDLRYGETDFRGDVTTIDLPGDSGWNPLLTGQDDQFPNNYTGRFGGTSAACPQVAGIAAMILSRRPEFICDTTHKIVRNVIIGSAIDLGAPGPDNYYGYGRANAYRALLAVIRGDVNNDGTIDPVDVVLLVNCIYKNWCNLQPEYCVGDCDCSGTINPVDAVYLVNHVYKNLPMQPICTNFMED